MATADERLATIEEQIRELRAQVADRKAEEQRTRDRLHAIEGAVKGLVTVQKEARAAEATQYRRVAVRIQVLTLVVAVATIVVPLSLALVHTH